MLTVVLASGGDFF